MAWSTKSGNSPVGPGGVANGGGGKSNGAGSNGNLLGATHIPGSAAAAEKEYQKRQAAQGKASGAGSNDTAPTITRTSTQPLAPTGPTYDKTGRLLTDGPIASVPNASIGQLIGTLFSGLAPGGLGMLNSSADYTDPDDDTNGATTGGYVGRLIDGIRGVKPGAVEGSTGNPVAGNTNSRGDRPSDGSPGLGDHIAPPPPISDTGPDNTGTDTDFSSVQLADRRKPYGAGTRMLLGLA